jgi:hypothetical protein
VERRPIPAEGLSLYAAALLANGKTDAGAAVLQVAAGRGWRDRFVQRVVILSALQQDTPEIAANRVIALWRLGETGNWLEDLTQATLEAPGGLAAFENALIDRDPHLGTDFLIWATGSVPFETTASLARQMATHRSEFNCTRFSGQIENLLRDGRVLSATVVWDSFCATGQHSKTGDLRFATADSSPGPFDWRYPENPGLDVELLESSGRVVLHYSSSNPVLRIIARRFLVLSPGRHIVLFDKAGGHPDAKWSVACVTETESKSGLRLETGGGGQSYFTVPAQCAVQELTVAVRSGSGNIGSPKLN